MPTTPPGGSSRRGGSKIRGSRTTSGARRGRKNPEPRGGLHRAVQDAVHVGKGLDGFDTELAWEAIDKAGTEEAANVTDGWKLGRMHTNGTGVPKDKARANELYRKACDGGDKFSSSKLGK